MHREWPKWAGRWYTNLFAVVERMRLDPKCASRESLRQSTYVPQWLRKRETKHHRQTEAKADELTSTMERASLLTLVEASSEEPPAKDEVALVRGVECAPSSKVIRGEMALRYGWVKSTMSTSASQT